MVKNLKNKKILIYGMSLSGEWASQLAKKYGANVFLYDDDNNKLMSKELSDCFIVRYLNFDIIKDLDMIIVSPSISKDNKYLEYATQHFVPILSEVEFASKFCKNYVAITGTNGKTTTVDITAKLLSLKHKAVACGNIGYPLSRAVLNDKRAIKVIEVSSFMLENCKTFSPHIATITNIEPDHLIRHGNMVNYENLKYSIYSNMSDDDYAIVNLDNKNKVIPHCKIISYSYSKKADIYVKNGYIYHKFNRIIALKDLKILGKHNVYNVMCAIAIAKIFKVKDKYIGLLLSNYVGGQYRIQSKGEFNKRKFINDSKSTNIASTLACVSSVGGSIILLLGGSNKSLNYKELFEKLSKRVKLVVVYGQIAEKLEKSNNLKFPMHKVKTLPQAFDVAVKYSKPCDSIVLSPASASFDQFDSYIERGACFDRKVKEYEKNTEN